MNNFALFVCGVVVTLMSGMGVLVYTVSLAYKKQKAKAIAPHFVEPFSSVEIPSVS